MFTLFKSLNFAAVGFLLALSGLSLPRASTDSSANSDPQEPIFGAVGGQGAK
jgi:hypothetical protein